jgi:hypothetical protein
MAEELLSRGAHGLAPDDLAAPERVLGRRRSRQRGPNLRLSESVSTDRWADHNGSRHGTCMIASSIKLPVNTRT